MEENQKPSISEEQIWEKIEEMGGFEELAQKEEFFKCERDWWEAPTAALKSIKDPSPEVKTALEICMAVLEYSKGNFDYQPKDLSARILSSNMRRVIKTSLEARVRQKAKNALAGKASAEKRKNASAEESQHKTAQEYTSQQESAREDTSQHVLPQEYTSQQESARANHITITEQNRTEQNRTEQNRTEQNRRNKYEPTTTTNNSSSGKISLSVSKAIDILDPCFVDNFDSALEILKNNSRKEELTREEKIAAVLYLLTGRTRSNISRITNLIDEAVSKGAKELDVLREVYFLALQASGQDNSFEDKQQCRISTGSIINRLREIVKQSEAAQEQFSVEETQPSLATPQQQETEQPQQVVEQPQQETEQPKQAAEQPQQSQPVEETQQSSLAIPQQQETEQPQQPQQETEQLKPLRLAVVPQAKFSVERQSQLSLSVHETIDFITHNGCKTYRKAFTAIKEHGGNIDVQKTVVALYFLTGKSQPEVLEITGLVDKVVNKEAGKEEDVCKEVFKMATDTKDSNDCNFDDRNGCRAAIDRIKNYINKLLFEKYLNSTRI